MKRTTCFALFFFVMLLAVAHAGAAEPLFLEKIDFDIQPDGSERACFAFSAPFSPHLFALEGEKPRIVVDVPQVAGWSGDPTYAVSGTLARRIRCHFHRDTGKLRIVVDLDPALDFVVDPLLDENRNILCIQVRREPEAQRPSAQESGRQDE